MKTTNLIPLLTHSMMTPMERAMGRFMRAPDGHGGDDGKKFTQADIDKAVEKAVGDLDGLRTKVDELTKEAKDAKAKLRAASEIKPEDLTAAEERADKAEAKVKELEKAAKDATTAKEKAEKALETESAFTQRLLIQDGLKSALIANGVKDEDFIDSLTAKFASGAAIKVDGEERKAMYGDKPLHDFIKEWAGSDAGKKFVQAPANSGGGAGGGGGGDSGAKTMSRTDYDEKIVSDPVGTKKFISEGGKIVNETA